jgi:hypothetical protein
MPQQKKSKCSMCSGCNPHYHAECLLFLFCPKLYQVADAAIDAASGFGGVKGLSSSSSDEEEEVQTEAKKVGPPTIWR